MKKNYFLLVCLVLVMAVSAKAQINSVVDLFGKYRFTADVEFTAAGEAYKQILSNDCEAVIEADDVQEGRIIGFAGSQVKQNVQGVDGNNINIINPNNPTLWDNGLLLANENGDHPYGVFEEGEWKVDIYNSAVYTYDPTAKVISVPNFTVVKLENGAPVLVAKYTNVKMTLTEAMEVEVVDISGEWNFKAGSGTYSTMEGSVIPKEFPVTLEKTADNNMAYNATLAIEGYEPVVLPATFDGNILSIAYDSTYLDPVNEVRFGDMNATKGKKGNVEFKAQSETVFSLHSGFTFLVDSLGKNKAEDADSIYVIRKQWYMDGTLKSKVDAPTVDWSGVYNVSLKNADQDLYIKDAAGFEWPAEFQFEVTYYEAIEKYFITKIFGLDVVNLNNGGLPFVPAEDGKSVEISTGLLYTVESQVKYLALRDMNRSTNAIKATVNEDGTMSVSALSIVTVTYGENAGESLNASYSNLNVAKRKEFNWAGTHTISAKTVTAYDGQEYPASFDMTVIYNEDHDMYLVTSFIGNEVGALNNGGIVLTIADDGQSAKLNCGSYLGGKYPEYLILRDMNGGNEAINFVLNADGSVSVDDFFVQHMNYETNATSPAVLYGGVTTNIENIVVENDVVEGIFDMQGLRVSEIVAPGLYIVNGKKVLVK